MLKRYRDVNIVFAITILVVFIAGFLPIGEIFHNQAMIFLFSQLIIFLPSLGYLIFTKQNYFQVVGIKKVSLSNVALLIFFAYCMSNVMGFISALSSLFAKNVITNAVSSTTSQNPMIVSLICVAVIPAVFEESIYRGIFYQEYRKVNPLGAIFLSALLFGLLHGNFNQFSYAFFMGMIFALVIEATDSIVSTMIIHFLINGTSVVLLYVLPTLVDGFEEQLADATQSADMTLGTILAVYGVRAVIFGAAGFFLFMRIAKNCNRWEHVKNIFKRKGEQSFWSLFTWPLIASIVFLIINMIANELM